MIERYIDIIQQQWYMWMEEKKCKTGNVNIGTSATREYRTMFHARCIENGETMSDVVMKGIKEYMASHPAKVEKFQGVS